MVELCVLCGALLLSEEQDDDLAGLCFDCREEIDDEAWDDRPTDQGD